jgi:hypothetical protein
MSFPGLDNVARIAAFVAILCSAASMTASVIALFRYKADMEKTVWHYDMAGAGTKITVCHPSILSRIIPHGRYIFVEAHHSYVAAPGISGIFSRRAHHIRCGIFIERHPDHAAWISSA